MERAAAWDHFVSYMTLLLMWLIPASFGRGAWYAYQLQRGKLKLTFGFLMGEAITSVFMAITAGGLSGRLHLQDYEALAFIGLASWLGPAGFFTLAVRLLRLDVPEEKKPEDKK